MLRNVGSNWILTLATIAVTYVLTPFVIDALGQEGYGTWTLITSLTGYVSLLALGVPTATVRYLTQHAAEKDARQLNATIGSCAGLYVLLGLIAGVAGFAMLMLLQTYQLPRHIEGDANVAFAVMVVYVSTGFVGLLPEGIMFAHHDFVIRNLVKLAGTLLRLSLTVGLLAVNASLLALALIQLTCLAFDFCVSWLLIRRRYPGVRISIRDFDGAIVRRIFSFSLFVLLLNAGARLSFETDALVIGAFLGVGAIPFFAVANSLVIYLMDFIIAIAAVVAPMATRLKTQGEMDSLRELFLKWSKISLSLTIAAGLFLFVLGSRFIGWWIDPSFEEPSAAPLQILVAAALLFLPVRGVAMPVLLGIGKPKAPAIGFIAAGVMNLVLSLLLVRPFGLAGVAFGTAIPNVLFAGFVLVLACRELQIPVGHYVRYVVPRAALGALPVVALLTWFKVGLDVQTLPGLAAAGSAMAVLFGLTWVFFVYRHDPYVDLRPHLTRLRVWSRA